MAFQWEELSKDVSNRMTKLWREADARLAASQSELVVARDHLAEVSSAVMAANLELDLAKVRLECAKAAASAHQSMVDALPWNKSLDASGTNQEQA